MIPDIRIGQGYDVHCLVENRPLILCGVEVPHTHGLLGHSDADVAIHALCDALIGAAAMGDIGALFPDTDQAFKDIDSRILLREVMKRLRKENYSVGNIDITIIAQAPKLRPYIDQMRANMAEDTGLDISRVSVKATTTEKLGFTGRREGIASMAVALLLKE